MNTRLFFFSFILYLLCINHALKFSVFLNQGFGLGQTKSTLFDSYNSDKTFEEFRLSITDISHWYERRNLPKVRRLVENTLYPLLLQYSNDENQQEAQVALNMMFDLLQRWAFNYCIQITLGLFPNSKSTNFLRNLDTYLVNLAERGLATADTINILLSDAVRRSNIRRADNTFELFFISSSGQDGGCVGSGLVVPTVRSINIMMEAHRRCAESSTSAQDYRTKKSWSSISESKVVDEADRFQEGNVNIEKDYRMVRYYYSLFTSSYGKNWSSPMEALTTAPLYRNHLHPDCYTLSTLVRISSQPEEIVELLTQNPAAVTPPVLRCAIESLGNLGDPSAALMLFLQQRRYKQTSNDSNSDSLPVGRKTGDAIITALLSCPSQRLNLTAAFGEDLCGKLSADVATDLLFDGQSDESKYCIRCSSKGYTLLFTHIQRSLRRLFEPVSFSSETPDHAEESSYSQRLRLAAAANLRNNRNRLFEYMKGEIIADKSSTEWERNVADDENPSVELNSRLVDALVRSYQCEDIDEAKLFWKRNLLPLVLLSNQSHSQFSFSQDGLLETGLETLMFLCGRNSRPDVGLEIARTVRKRFTQRQSISSTSNDTRLLKSKPRQLYQERLYKAYLQGARDATHPEEGALSNPFKPLLKRNWEDSIRLELGIQSRQTNGPVRIRIRFK